MCCILFAVDAVFFAAVPFFVRSAECCVTYFLAHERIILPRF